MTDNELVKIFYSILRQGLDNLGYSNVVLMQSYQPTLQGVPKDPAVFFFKLSNRRYGFLKRDNQYIIDTAIIKHTESQFFEVTYQFQCLKIRNPMCMLEYTAGDLIDTVASIMQSDATRKLLNNDKIGILRAITIDNPYFVDDRDMFESAPFINLTLVYSSAVDSPIAKIDSITTDIYGV